jgi:hypothetical protein
MIRGNPTNLELLRLATELAYADYNNRRANLHNQWLADNDRMMKLYRTAVPYPTIPHYPTEEEIISKAQRLIEFLSAPGLEPKNQELQQGVSQLIADIEQNTEASPADKHFANTAIATAASTATATATATDLYPAANQRYDDAVYTTVDHKVSAEKTSVFDKLRNVLR